MLFCDCRAPVASIAVCNGLTFSSDTAKVGWMVALCGYMAEEAMAGLMAERRLSAGKRPVNWESKNRCRKGAKSTFNEATETVYGKKTTDERT